MTVVSGLSFGTVLELIVCVFLVATIAYCAALDRRLRAMRSGQDGLKALVAELNGATERAVSAIDALKQASLSTNEELGERLRVARGLADELTLMVDAGNNIADRLGRNDRPATPRAATPQPASGPRMAPPPVSARDAATAARAANQLLDALKKAR